jgi:hypothetical protein
MDELLQRALERRKRLRDELEALDSFIRSYSAVKERDVPPVQQADLFSRSQPRTRVRRAAEINAAMDDAEKLILEAGIPLTRSVLLKALEELGHDIEGADKSKVLGTNLWRSKRFHNLKGAGYWPISSPIPHSFEHLAKRESMLLEDGGK